MGTQCAKCAKQIPVDDRGEMDLELHVSLSGGYGSFHDSAVSGPEELVLCHECAHALCDFLGVNPHNWHSHPIDRRSRLLAEGHTGWDLEDKGVADISDDDLKYGLGMLHAKTMRDALDGVEKNRRMRFNIELERRGLNP